MMKSLALCIAGLSLLILLSPPPARACSAPAPGYFVEAPDGTLEGVPLEGVLALPAHRIGDGDVVPDITVTDERGTVVPGSVESILVRTQHSFSFSAPHTVRQEILVWRASEPLAPEALYHAELPAPYDDGSAPTRFDFRTSASPYAGLAPLMGRDIRARRAEVPGRDEPICGPPTHEGVGSCDECTWGTSIEVVELAWMLDEQADRYAYYRLRTDAGGEIRRKDTLFHPTVMEGALYFRDRSAQYCVYVEAVSLVDGSTLSSEQVCVEDATLPELPRSESGSEGGCSAAGSSNGVPTVSVLALIAVAAWSRRRWSRSARTAS